MQDRIYYCGATTGTNAYTVSNSDITAYKDGLIVRIKIGTASTGASSLNINGLEAKTILDTLGNPITANGLKAGLPYQLCYNGTNFIVLGKGGGGNLTSGDLLINKTATGDSGVVTGSMPENGQLNANLNCGQSYNVPAGHASGGTIIANSLASQTPANADASKILSGSSAWVNGNLINGQASIASLGGEKFASSSTNASSSTLAFTQDNLTSANFNYISIGGLNFTPEIIICYWFDSNPNTYIGYWSIYWTFPGAPHHQSLVRLCYKNENSGSVSYGSSVNAAVSPCSIAYGNFLIPVNNAGAGQLWYWAAYGS